MKANIFLLFPLIIFQLLSCEKDEVRIYTGNYDTSFIYYEYSPALELTFIRDEQISSNVGKDSIDIDSDTNYDLIMTLVIPDYFLPYCQLELKNGFEIVICKESYAVGHGQSSTAIFVDTLTFGNKINNLMDWSGDQYFRINMWHAIPEGGLTPSYGSWFYTKTKKYIGIRSHLNKYGWIEVNAVDPYNPKILKYAIQK